jgi:hypothetical protein
MKLARWKAPSWLLQMNDASPASVVFSSGILTVSRNSEEGPASGESVRASLEGEYLPELIRSTRSKRVLG